MNGAVGRRFRRGVRYNLPMLTWSPKVGAGANFFAIITFVYLVLRKAYPKLIFPLLFIGIIIAYSRIYLGVHYLSDVFVGGLVGSLIAFLVHRLLYLRFSEKVK